MKINLPKILSAHNIAVASFYVIVIASILGLARSLETEKNRLAPYQWLFVVTGSVAYFGGCCLVMKEPEDRTLADKNPDRHTGNPEDNRGSRSGDVHVHTHAVLDASFDKKLAIVSKDVAEIAQRMGALDMALAKQISAIKPIKLTVKEKEQQARYALIARLSDLGTESSPIDALQRAVQICSDARLWEHPARAVAVHIDTQRFYNEGKIWPKVRDNRIVWSLDPDYDPPDETEQGEQTPFHPFSCCIWCKYISKHYDSCAVMPFGCGTGDRTEQCREFESAGESLPCPALTIDDIPF